MCIICAPIDLLLFRCSAAVCAVRFSSHINSLNGITWIQNRVNVISIGFSKLFFSFIRLLLQTAWRYKQRSLIEFDNLWMLAGIVTQHIESSELYLKQTKWKPCNTVCTNDAPFIKIDFADPQRHPTGYESDELTSFQFNSHSYNTTPNCTLRYVVDRVFHWCVSHLNIKHGF